MKKLIFVFALISFFNFNMDAQVEKVQTKKGDITLDLGVGVFPFFAVDNGTTNIWPVTMTLNYRIKKNISLGGFAGFTAATSAPILLADGIPVEYRNDTWLFGLKSAAHVNPVERLEIYGGALLAYSLPRVSTHAATLTPGQEPIDPTTPTQDAPYKFPPATGKLVFGGFVGGSYLFTNRIGAFAELGYGVALLNAGVRLKW